MTYRLTTADRISECLLSFFLAFLGVSIPAFIVAFFTPSIAPAVVFAFCAISATFFIAALVIALFNRFF